MPLTNPSDQAKVDLLNKTIVIGAWTDEKFQKGFEEYDATLYEIWNHTYFLRIVLLYLNSLERRDAVNKIHDNIIAFYHNQPEKCKSEYHFTIIYFWIQIVDFCRNHRKQGNSKDSISLLSLV